MLIGIDEFPDSQGEISDKGEYTRKFLGRSNSLLDREPQILASPLCPKRGQPDPYARGAVYSNVRASPYDTEDVDTLWMITTQSTTEFIEQEEDPLEQEAEIEWFDENYEEYRFVDGKGEPILNTASDYMAVKFEASKGIISVAKNIPSLSEILFKINNKINSGTVMVDGIPFPRQTLLCKGMRQSKKNRKVVNGMMKVWRVATFRLYINMDKWKVKVPNVGYNELFGEIEVPRRLKSNPRKFARYSRGNPDPNLRGQIIKDKVPGKRRIQIGDEYPNEPQPLDKQGKWIDTADKNFKPSMLVQLEKIMHEEISFSGLPLN